MPVAMPEGYELTTIDIPFIMVFKQTEAFDYRFPLGFSVASFTFSGN